MNAKKALIDVLHDTIEITDDLTLIPSLLNKNNSNTGNVNVESSVLAPNLNILNDNPTISTQNSNKSSNSSSTEKMSLFITDLKTFDDVKVSQKNAINRDTIQKLVSFLLFANLQLNVSCMYTVLCMYSYNFGLFFFFQNNRFRVLFKFFALDSDKFF